MAGSGTDGAGTIPTLLHLLRRHLAMDAVVVSELADDRRVLRHVDAAITSTELEPGRCDPARGTYSHQLVAGALPAVLPDAARHPVAAAIPATHRVPVGTHVGVPIRFGRDRVYGALHVFSHRVVTAPQTAIGVVESVANLITAELEDAGTDRDERAERAARLTALRPGQGLVVVAQPVVDLLDGGIVGVQALSRFPTLPYGPAEVFAEAWDVGVGVRLEHLAIDAALSRLDAVPQDCWLGVKASAATVAAGGLRVLLERVDASRVVIEVAGPYERSITATLLREAEYAQDRGARLMLRTTGCGDLSSLLALGPALLLLDGSLVAGVVHHGERRAVVAGLVAAAQQLGIAVVAQHVETPAQQSALIELGVGLGQGFHLARPAALSALVRHHARRLRMAG